MAHDMNHIADDLPAGPKRRGRWFLSRVAGSLWSNFRDASRELPAGTWRRWAARLAIGWTACAAVTAGVTICAKRWEPTGMGEWDSRTIRAIERGPVSFIDAVLLESPGNLIYMIPLVICVAAAAVRLRRPVFAMTVLASWVLARSFVFWGWCLWDRERPQVIEGGVAAPALHSFPSGHVVLGLSVYGLLAYAWCRASASGLERAMAIVLCAAWCASLGYARVRLGSHWPSDVLGGAVVGLAWIGAAIWALRATETPHVRKING